MVAVSLEAQQSSVCATWIGVVRTAAGEPVAGAKVTVYTGRKRMTAVRKRRKVRDADIDRAKSVSVQLPGRGPTASTGVILPLAVVLTVSDQNVLSIAANPQTRGSLEWDENFDAASGTAGETLQPKGK
jgi:hypothetical protein